MRLFWLFILTAGCALGPQQPADVPQSAIKASVKKSATQTKTGTANPAADALKQKLKRSQVVLLDVRTPEEHANGRVVGSKNLNFLDPDFAKFVAGLDPKKEYLLYCASGNRSGKALQHFNALGIKATSIAPYGELKEWGLPVEGVAP